MLITTFIIRLALAFGLGVLVGLERQYRQKSAGLRTNTLVSVGSAAYILLSLSLTDDLGDPSRVAGQIVTGIGFLGAGVIMKTGMTVQGLNTAATIWCSAAIGAMAGAGLYIESTLLALFVVLGHILLRPIGILLNRMQFKTEESGFHYYHFRIKCKEQVENHIRVLILQTIKPDDHLKLRSLKSSDNGNPAYAYIDAEIESIGNHHSEMENLAGKLTIEYGVTEVRWEIANNEN